MARRRTKAEQSAAKLETVDGCLDRLRAIAVGLRVADTKIAIERAKEERITLAALIGAYERKQDQVVVEELADRLASIEQRLIGKSDAAIRTDTAPAIPIASGEEHN